MVSEEEQRAARAKVITALGVFALVLVAVIIGLIWAGHQSSPAGSDAGAAPSDAATPPAAAGSGGPAAPGGWDVAAETALATRLMRQFPDTASMPQTLAPSGLPVIDVPDPTRTNNSGVGEGFPATPEGAIGQLAALEVVGLADLNPDTYNAVYRSVSLPGAPDPAATPLGVQVDKVYSQVVLQGSTGQPISSRWQLAGAQVKGVTSGGRSVVVCVAGELQLAQVNSAQTGTGDCQAMRWTGSDWRIAPVPVASAAPVTWPGSPAFVQAGYHPTNGGPV